MQHQCTFTKFHKGCDPSNHPALKPHAEISKAPSKHHLLLISIYLRFGKGTAFSHCGLEICYLGLLYACPTDREILEVFLNDSD